MVPLYKFSKVVSIKKMAISIMSAKLPTTDLLKTTEFWQKGYKVIAATVIVEVIVKILSRDSKYDLDVIILEVRTIAFY